MMSLVASVDPDMERKIKQEYRSLKSNTNVAGDTDVPGNPLGPSDSPVENHLGVVFSDVAQAPSDFKSVEQMDGDGILQTVQTPSLEELAGFLHDSAQALDQADKPEERLKILLERELSLLSAEQKSELSSVLADALAVGETVFRKSLDEDPLASWKARPTAGLLSTMVQAAAMPAPQIVLERIRDVRTSVLQAQLYVSFVKGLESEGNSASVEVAQAEK